MARTRTIRPGFWADEKLATLSREARLFFIGLWTVSDDYGVVKGHPVWLKSQIFPFDELPLESIKKWIEDLEGCNLLVGFEYHKEKYYYIANFLKHQKIDHPSKTRNPEPPDSIRETIASESRDNRYE